ncbi:RDD family protein [Actinoplanes bogorensis]|uniref:RDD family protein n=2 Tax=Paractinoplanes bogorensis TaxID=1610840 RepID=A0ABS5YKJ2_9ACTN|nr:RDD family protein [Actinoplanes bogorensis]
MYAPGPPPPPLSPGGVPLAEFPQRLVAYIIDSVLLSVVAMIVAIPAFIVLFRSFPDPVTYTDNSEPDFNVFFGDFLVPLLLLEAGLFVLMFLLYYVYVVEVMYRSGQTLGKKIMKIRVVPLDPEGKLTRGMAAKRYLVEFVAGGLVPFFSWVDGLWQLGDKPYQQTLHDKFAQTVVVKVSP